MTLAATATTKQSSRNFAKAGAVVCFGMAGALMAASLIKPATAEGQAAFGGTAPSFAGMR